MATNSLEPETNMLNPRPYIASLLAPLFLLALPARSLPAQSQSPDYEDVDPWVGVKPPNPGPDSSAVAGFIGSLVAANPVVCQFVVQSIGNHWGGRDHHYQSGYLVAEQGVEKERQTLSRAVTDHAALSYLAQALGHESSCVRRAAATMLGHSDQPEAVRYLRSALGGGDARRSEAAALGLADAEDPAAFHDLSRALRDPNTAVARMAAYALGELEDARAVKPLGELLRSPDPETRAAAASALGEIEDIRATDRLNGLVRDADYRVRLAAIEALGEIEDHRSTGVLTQALKDKQTDVRRAAAEALGEVENPKAADALAQSLDDPDVVVRRLAAQALGELDDLQRAPPRLIAALADRDAELRVIAAMSLGEIGDSSAVPSLSRAYTGAEPRLRFAVVHALSEMEDRRGDAVLAIAAREKDTTIRRVAAEALKDRHDDDNDDD
jgi:HEAT repeat protein